MTASAAIQTDLPRILFSKMLRCQQWVCSLFTLLLALTGILGTSGLHAQIRITAEAEVTGTIESIANDQVTIRTQAGESLDLKIQDAGEEAIALSERGVRLRFPCQISVRGERPIDSLQRGDVLQIEANLNRRGRTEGELRRVISLGDEAAGLGIEMIEEPENGGAFFPARITGVFEGRRNQRMEIRVPRNEFVRSERLFFTLAEDAVVAIESASIRAANVGDEVASCRYARLSTGDLAVQAIEIQIQADGNQARNSGGESKFLHLDDTPQPPRTARHGLFVIHTDISERQLAILVDRLGTMIELISRYYGSTTPQPIECFVIRDLQQWQDYPLREEGRFKIARGEGVTFTERLGRTTKSVVYSCDDFGVVQHEAVHAFCAQTFGSTGPTWYAEGMAELGQYWAEDEIAVNIEPFVINYLTAAEPKSLLSIVEAGQITGDSWQAYAWRWALCHLLAHNPNYSGRFKALGISMMRSRGDSFESVYGPVANEISFEYAQFVQNFGNGYRADLCAWDWQKAFQPIRTRRKSTFEVDSMRGWQATGIEVDSDWSIQFSASGTWRTSAVSPPCTAAGDQEGTGALVGVLLHNFELSEVFEIGEEQTIRFAQPGRLYLRCRDDWCALHDNEGSIEISMERVVDRD